MRQFEKVTHHFLRPLLRFSACSSAPTPTRSPPRTPATTSKPTASNPSSSSEVPQQCFSVKVSRRFPQRDIWPRIVSEHAVIRPDSMPSAEITPHKPTSRKRSDYAENVVCYPFIEFSRRGPTRTLHGG